MYKDAEFIRNNQNNRAGKLPKSVKRGLRQNAEKHPNIESPQIGEQKIVQAKAKHFPHYLPTIPAIKVKAPLFVPSNNSVEFFIRKKNLSILEYLKAIERVLPDYNFTFNGSIPDLLKEISKVLSQHFGYDDLDIKDGNIIIAECSFSFSYVYAYDMLTFHNSHSPFYRKIVYAFIRKVGEVVGFPEFVSQDYDYYESWMFDEEGDDMVVKEQIVIAKEVAHLILEESNHIDLNLERDQEWICDAFRYNGYEELIPYIKDIISMVLNAAPSLDNVKMEDASIYEFVNFSTMPEDFYNNYIVNPMIEYANETMMAVNYPLSIPINGPITYNPVPMDALYCDRILAALAEIINYEPC